MLSLYGTSAPIRPWSRLDTVKFRAAASIGVCQPGSSTGLSVDELAQQLYDSELDGHRRPTSPGSYCTVPSTSVGSIVRRRLFVSRSAASDFSNENPVVLVAVRLPLLRLHRALSVLARTLHLRLQLRSNSAAPSFSEAAPDCRLCELRRLLLNDVVVAAVRWLADKQHASDPLPTRLHKERVKMTSAQCSLSSSTARCSTACCRLCSNRPTSHRC